MKQCLDCGSVTTWINKKRNYEQWYSYKDGYLCSNCHGKHYNNENKEKVRKKNEQWRKSHPDKIKEYSKKWNPILGKKWHPITNPKHQWYKGKIIIQKENPRKGICERCGAIKGINCKVTAIHHIEYHDNDPLKDTVELCASCHTKEGIRLGQLTGIYKPKDLSDRFCIECNGKKTHINKKGFPVWHRHPNKDGWLCNTCRFRVYYHLRKSKNQS